MLSQNEVDFSSLLGQRVELGYEVSESSHDLIQKGLLTGARAQLNLMIDQITRA